MNNTISNIAKELEKLSVTQTTYGLRDNGLTGIVLLFFFYARFLGKEKYEKFAKNLLEKALSNILNYKNSQFHPLLSDLGRTVSLLANEKFFEIEDSEFTKYFEEPLMLYLRNNHSFDFGFNTGITGICDFLLDKATEQEALDITLGHIYSGLRVKGYPKHPVESLLLFPSEILRDLKIFLIKLEKANIPVPQKNLLKQAIRRFESKKVLNSNCPEYYILQDLREAVIMDDQLKIQSLLEIIASSSSDLVFKGLASMSLEDNSLPAWWKLV